MKIQNTTSTPDVISYQTIRRSIGYLGIGLPFALLLASSMLGCMQMQPSISHYFYTQAGCLFVGVLCAVGLFLISYKGYSTLDAVLTNIAGILAFCIAFFPTGSHKSSTCALFVYNDFNIRIIAHYASAGLFFLILAFISYFLFTQSKGHKTVNKVVRNRVYRVCALIMVISIALVPVCSSSWLEPTLAKYNPTFWLECSALISFGTSWLIKGEALLGDSK